MREILFRGKKSYENVWVEGFYCVKRYKYAGDKSFVSETHKITTGIVEASGAYQEHEEEREYTVIPETVGQYTGLTDKNGKKIFEGDIVKAMYRIKYKEDYVLGTVVFENGTFKLSVVGTAKKGEFALIASSIENYKTSMYAIENNFIFRGYSLEVIGNIHDNPELLKGGAEE